MMAFPRPSFGLIVGGIFIAYLLNSTYTFYHLFYPAHCGKGQWCIQPFLRHNPKLELQVHIRSSKTPPRTKTEAALIYRNDSFDIAQPIEKTFNISIPGTLRKKGSLYAHVFVGPRGESVFSNSWVVNAVSDLTTMALPKAETFNLMGGSQEGQERNYTEKVKHLRSRLTFSVMQDLLPLDRQAVPQEIHGFLRLSPESEYLPVLYVDELSNRVKHLVMLNGSREMELTVSYSPISVGKLRLWVNMQQSMQMLMGLGFTEKDTDELKGILVDTNFYFLMLTFLVAAFHLLFDFLAFKNDITYWKRRKTMEGLSTKTVLWRCVSTFVVFLYLMDEKTSLLVLCPAGIGALIELWKVKKAFKATLNWNGWRPSIQFGAVSAREKETEAFDSEAMKYLWWLLYPLCATGAAYSLLYVQHKSWYSWCINSLVNGVYAFGFLFMLPQLFVNYKMKSVAHLPWRAFMYKAFNTFIDDVFAFIITMPTAHRLACFRDDIVFLIYLYQRWLYPVDRTRVNEYGESFDENAQDDKAEVEGAGNEETKKTQ